MVRLFNKVTFLVSRGGRRITVQGAQMSMTMMSFVSEVVKKPVRGIIYILPHALRNCLGVDFIQGSLSEQCNKLRIVLASVTCVSLARIFTPTHVGA